jgi:two-component system sensor histidine kinase KdpD
VAAAAGRPLDDAERLELESPAGRVQSLGPASPAAGISRVVLTADGRPIGVLAVGGGPSDPYQWELLRTYANQAALAIERSSLREQALRTRLLEQVDRWRGAMMAAVSHDLRTPLATIKTAVSTLRTGPALDPGDRRELLALIEHQTDNLDRLVGDLLDMTRIEAGMLAVHRTATPLRELVQMGLDALGAEADGRVEVTVPDQAVDVDPALMAQVVANLVDNALRVAPPDSPVEITAQPDGPERVELAVTDHGPGVPWADRERVFEMFNRMGGGGRAGLGLAIVRSFVDAHDGHVRVEDAPGGGARFVVTLAAAAEDWPTDRAPGAVAQPLDDPQDNPNDGPVDGRMAG